MARAVAGTGAYARPPAGAVLDARLAAADKPGEHLWVLLAAWMITDPERPSSILDAENLIQFSGPGCFKCELEYSRKLARRRCQGSTG